MTNIATAREFRLLRATASLEHRDLFSRRYESAFASGQIEFSNVPNNPEISSPWTTVVIGKNGVGKSRLLAGLAQTFDNVGSRTRNHQRDDCRIRKIEYWADGSVFGIELDDERGTSFTIDGELSSRDDLLLPSKVIALTTTPFDKFRITGRRYRDSLNQTTKDNDIYSYLGLRDRTGRASTTAAIFRSLEGLFGASEANDYRRSRVAEVFRFLGYEPEVKVIYSFAGSSVLRLQRLAEGVYPSKVFEDTGARSIEDQLEKMIQREPWVVAEISDAAKEVLNRSYSGKTVEVKANFLSGYSDERLFRQVQLLRRAGIVRMRSAFLMRTRDETQLDLTRASSGELSIVTGFLGLASVIEPGSLVFVDEPEISLHPEWQEKYVDLLFKTFEKFTGCHFILATHSPLILSDIVPERSNVLSLDPDRLTAESGSEFAGQSPDSILVTAFQLATKNNLFLKQQVIKVLRLLADHETSSEEVSEAIEPLARLLPSIDENEPLHKLLDQVERLRKEAGQDDD